LWGKPGSHNKVCLTLGQIFPTNISAFKKEVGMRMCLKEIYQGAGRLKESVRENGAFYLQA
jgi:hypothetical protein